MKDLNECRKEIDEIDQQLIKLFEQRMKISKEEKNMANKKF